MSKIIAAQAAIEDYLKTHKKPQWQPGSPEFEAMRKLGRTHNDATTFLDIAATRPPETIANMAIILINQADYLLFRQLEKLSNDFLDNGGFSERMSKLRHDRRGY